MKRLICGLGQRRGGSRAVAVLLAVVLSILAAGCGGGSSDVTEGEKAADIEVLNAALALERTAIGAYSQGLPLLRGPLVAVGREFRAQDQEHVDALTKAIRGLGGETEAEAGELENPGPKNQTTFLALAYGEESALLDAYLDAAPRLQTAAPRLLAASLAANHAQHLVVLRQALGAGLAASVPEAFEPGDLRPPGGGSRPETAEPPRGAR